MKHKISRALIEKDDSKEYKEAEPPPHFTFTKPGSPEKIAVMADRIANGFHPHHEGDLYMMPDGTCQVLHRGRNGQVFQGEMRTA